MKRRDFLRFAAAAGIAVPLSWRIPGGIIGDVEGAEKVDLAVAGGSSPAKTTRAAIDAAGGIGKYVSKGDIVVVKPNIGWDRTPEQAANTNPEVVATIVALCYEAGAKKVKVFDRTVNDPRRCYKQSGIIDAAQKAGAEVSFIDDRKFKDMSLRGETLKSWPLYTEVFEADKVINVPVAKHHSLAGLTLAMKNWMGIMGGRRGQIHQRIDENLVDLARFVKPALTVLDAVRILTANGPQGGDLRDVRKLDTVIAGVDQVAVDAYGATLFGLKGANLGYVKKGAAAGLGVMDLGKLKIKKVTV